MACPNCGAPLNLRDLAEVLDDTRCNRAGPAQKAGGDRCRAVVQIKSIAAMTREAAGGGCQGHQFTRRGYDRTRRTPLIADAMAPLPASSIVVDVEAVYCDNDGAAVFEKLILRLDERV
jgi:hypothetical protein